MLGSYLAAILILWLKNHRMGIMPEQKFNLPELEEKILKFWEDNKIFEKSLEKTKKGKTFVFYEGPPTANGLPGVHHAEARAFKDVILRYKTMRGFHVPRKAGWDTHGLPVEIEVEKALGFKTKQDIESYGIASFNQKAKESVWRYKNEWERATKRLGFWLDLEHPYVTYETTYIESLWWVIKEIWKKGLLYQDFKVVPWCPRCQTGLSSHELGLGYKKVKEDSIYVKLKIKGKKNEYLLVWTTTPWTLPANVAVAVNPKLEYTKFKVDKEFLWSLRTPPYEKGQEISVMEKAPGRELLGLAYEPLFPYRKEHLRGREPEYVVIPGEFVSTEEGTGLVHIAPAFGDEDMNAARAVWKDSYPLLHTVNPDGTMKRGVIGEGKFAKDADRLIVEDLARRNLLLRVESHEHDYPFCWRCSTPLLYFAKTAWWIKMSALRASLLANNEKINWIPEHIKRGRFGEFLKEVRDWAFSRERYWGTPLPVWECTKCKRQEVIGSRDELARRSLRARNQYFIMRHSEAEHNLRNVISSAVPEKPESHLTLQGRKMVEGAAKSLAGKGIDMIVASDFTRTKETAEIVGKILGIGVTLDPRLREISGLDGFPSSETGKYISSFRDRLVKKVPGGETISEVRSRIFPVVYGLEKNYGGKKILIIGHEHPLWILYAASSGLTDEEMFALRVGKREEWFIHYAEVMEMLYKNLPRDETGAVDLHRPYVDSFSLICGFCGGVSQRVPEVVDVWFDSGAMPFAQAHWPFTRQDKSKRIRDKKLAFPADYIVEAVDQTRGWFYTLLAVSTLLGRGAPYRNVISLGHVLDKNGQKMSKSKGNAVDPGVMIQKYGADALRWYFYTVNAPGDPKRFDENDLFGVLRSFLGTFWNSFLLFETYVDKVKGQKSKVKSSNLLDRWIIAKLDVLVREVTRKLDRYDITAAARLIEGFAVNYFSQWYLRRSRSRFQHPKNRKEAREVAMTTAHVLTTLCKVSAPFVPFLAEAVYREVQKKSDLKKISVHLAEWPKATKGEKRKVQNLLKDMEGVRAVVAAALKLRAEAGIKVRQPLNYLQLTTNGLRQKSELLDLIKEEVNVKEITFGEELKLDTKITPELKEEGMAREVVRNIQEMRKELGLKPKDKIRAQFSGSKNMIDLAGKWKEYIMRGAGARHFVVGGKKVFEIERELDFDGKSLWLGIVKAS